MRNKMTKIRAIIKNSLKETLSNDSVWSSQKDNVFFSNEVDSIYKPSDNIAQIFIDVNDAGSSQNTKTYNITLILQINKAKYFTEVYDLEDLIDQSLWLKYIKANQYGVAIAPLLKEGADVIDDEGGKWTSIISTYTLRAIFDEF